MVTVTKPRRCVWAAVVACVVEPENAYSAVLVVLRYFRGRLQMEIQMFVEDNIKKDLTQSYYMTFVKLF
jgi:hypothetical protein